MPIDVQAHRKMRQAQRQIEQLQELEDEISLDGRGALSHRLAQVRRAAEAAQNLKAQLAHHEEVLNDRDVVKKAKAQISRDFLKHVNNGGSPEEFLAEAPDQIVEARVALDSGLKEMASVAADALETARWDAMAQLREDYETVYKLIVERLDSLTADPQELAYTDYIEAAKLYESKRDKLQRIHSALAKQIFSYELSRVDGGENIVREYLLNVAALIAMDRIARENNEQLKLTELVVHTEDDEKEIERVRNKYRSSAGKLAAQVGN